MFLTQHPEAKVKLQSISDVRKAMDNYQVFIEFFREKPESALHFINVLLCRYCYGGQLSF